MSATVTQGKKQKPSRPERPAVNNFMTHSRHRAASGDFTKPGGGKNKTKTQRLFVSEKRRTTELYQSIFFFFFSCLFISVGELQ